MKVNSFIPLFFVFLIAQACTKETPADKPEEPVVVVKPPATDPVIPQAQYDLSLIGKATAFKDEPIVVAMKRQDYKELSGLAESKRYPGFIYVHEDSGNNNEVYITNTAGDDLGKIVLDGVYNRDWEDIAYGPGPDASKNYIYVAEIGDNDAKYPSIAVYRFPEPTLSATNNTVHITPEKLQFVYPKGAVNAESLLLDPITKDLYIATKEKAKSILYVARYPQSTSAVTTLTPLGSFPFDLLTAGDISPDGTEILVRNTGQIWYWKRLPNESIVTTMLRAPTYAPYFKNERQGEGIAFSADGSGYMTNSEIKKYPGEISSISIYKRK